MNRNTANIYNGISILFLTLTALVVIFVISGLTGPADDSEAVVVLPTGLVLPTVTPSFTPTETPTQTVTPTPTDTPTPTTTPTATITLAPSATITETPGPSPTPSDTPTPEVSLTPSPTETSSFPTMTFTPTTSPFFFELSGEVFFGPNGVNSAGCAWQGVGGSIIALDGSEATTIYQVRVFGGGIERVVQTGSNSLYGLNSGWEVPIGTQINTQTYFIRLETTVGTPLSENVQVTFPGDCNGNSAIVRFAQTQPFGPPPTPSGS